MSEEEKPVAKANPPGSYQDLTAWQKGITLVKLVYRFTATLPAEEKYGLVSQMRRAAVSVPSNLAEGQARKSTREFVQFVSHAEGSLAELETQAVLCVELEHTTQEQAGPMLGAITELRKILNGLRRSLIARLRALPRLQSR